MALETASYIANLVPSNPDGADQRNTADDHMRLIKACLKRTLPLLDGAVSLSQSQLMRLNDVSQSVQFQLNTLRDGSATAVNAIYANSASFARRAGTLYDPVGGELSLSAFRRSSSATYSGNLNLRQTAPRLVFDETDASISSSLAALHWDGRQWSLRFYDSQLSANYVPISVFRALDSTRAERIALQGDNVTLSASNNIGLIATTVTFNGLSLRDANLFLSGTLTTAVVSFAALSQHAHSLSVLQAGFAVTCTSASSAALLGGNAFSSQDDPSTVAVRNSAADLFCRYINTSQLSETAVVTSVATWAGDGYIRKTPNDYFGQNIEARNISGRTGTRKTLINGSGPPTISAGSQNGEMYFYY